MKKWEYASVIVGVGPGDDGKNPKKFAFALSTAHQNTNLPFDSNILVELDKLGGEGWEVVSVNQHVADNGMSTAYFLKRPVEEGY